MNEEFLLIVESLEKYKDLLEKQKMMKFVTE